MSDYLERLLSWLSTIPDWLVYLLLGITAALENVVPPIPADVIVIAGGVAAGAGTIDTNVLFVVVWLSNVASALLIYGIGRRYGPGFFSGPVGRFLLAPTQVDALAVAYQRFGVPIIFFSRFLPVFRPIVPVFAGLAHVGFWRTALPIACASGIWYGLLVYLAALAGANWQSFLRLIQEAGGWLWLVAGILLVLFGFWWVRGRASGRHPPGDR